LFSGLVCGTHFHYICPVQKNKKRTLLFLSKPITVHK